MGRALIITLALACAASMCLAVQNVERKATEPAGGVIEGTGAFVGKVVNVLTDNPADKNAAKKMTVADGRGKTMTFVVDPTVEFVDKVFNALTFDKLKIGEKVSVKYSGKGGAQKAESISVVK